MDAISRIDMNSFMNARIRRPSELSRSLPGSHPSRNAAEALFDERVIAVGELAMDRRHDRIVRSRSQGPFGSAAIAKIISVVRRHEGPAERMSGALD